MFSPRRFALAILTAIALVLCWLLTQPYLAGLSWGLALAVMAWPLHRWLIRHLTPNQSAAISTTLIVLLIAIPVTLVMLQLGVEAQHVVTKARERLADDRWKDELRRVPYVGEQLTHVDWVGQAKDKTERLASNGGQAFNILSDGVVQSLVAIFALFYFLRDRNALLREIRQRLPLPRDRSETVFQRAADAIHATVYGTLLCASIQAISGGVVFAALGVPAPIVWAAIVFVLGILPFVGGFLVWIPMAAWLVSQDRSGAALAVTAWGILMATVNNYIYAVAVGDRLALHPVPTLIAFIGGLAVFGVSGMVLGPCILAVTIALLDAWHPTGGEDPTAEDFSSHPSTPGQSQLITT